MHELSLSSAIVNTVVKHADGRRVSVVNLRVGHLRQVVPDSLEFYFEFVARGTGPSVLPLSGVRQRRGHRGERERVGGRVD